jgi:hypothetical protein
MPDQQIGKVTITSTSQPSLTNNVSSVTVRVNDQNTQRVGTISYSGGGVVITNAIANAAFAQANNAFDQANNAFNAANTASQSTGAFARANSAYAQANSAYNQANSATSIASGAFARANAAFEMANSDPSFANGAFEQANSAASFANSAFDRANAAFEMANSDPSFANGAFTTANSAFIQANNSFNVANASFRQANNSFNVANVSFNIANLAYAQANIATPAFAQSNNAFNVANASFRQANNAFNVANASFNQANNAFDSANNRVLRAGDTMTGLLGFNTTGRTLVGPIQYGPESGAIDLFAESENGYAQLNWANTNYVWVDVSGVYSSTNNTSFELNENAKHFRVYVPGYSLELSEQEGLIVDSSATITGQANVNSKLSVGVGSYVLLPNLIAQFTGNSSVYSQVNQQNLDPAGSGDMVITADNGTDLAYYSDLGKAGSEYSYYGPTGLIYPNDSYLIGQGLDGNRFGANLVIMATTSGFGDIVFAQGGAYQENETARFVYGDGFIIKRSLQANGIVDGTYNLKDYTSLVYNYANTISYNVSLSFAQANAAFDAANNAGQYAQPAYNQANNAFNVANAAFRQANNSFNVTNVAYSTANSAASFANGAFVTANSGASFANSAYAWANAAYDFANTVASQGAASAYMQANSAFDRANSAYDQANNAASFANSSYAFANTGYTQANNAANFANGAFDRANSSYAFANTGYTQANNAASFANGAFDRANSAYAQANSAASFANGAFTAANSKFSSSGGTISGDVSVTGNLSVSGTVTTVNTQILLVRDNIVTLDSTVPITVPAPSIDSGIEVNRGLYQNTQLVWSEVAGAWRMSDGNTFASIASANLVQAAFGQSNNAFNVANAAFLQANNAFNVTNVAFNTANSAASFANGSFLQANNAASFANSAYTKANNALANTTGTFAGDLTVTGNVSTVANVTANYFVTTGSAGVITGANLIYSNTFIASVGYQFPDGTVQTTAASASNIAASFAQANNAFNVANASFNQANNSFNVANVAYTQANNAASFANGAFVTANSAASFANGAFTQANNAASFANSAYAFANTGYTQANNAASFANGAFVTANSAASFANGAFARANSAYDFANTGYTQANNAASFANGAFARANSAYDFANTGYTQANNAGSFANSAFLQANNAASFANSAYTLANTNAGVNLTQNTNISSAQSYANSAFNIANASFSQANNSFNVANAAFTQANNSFNVANVAYTAANNAGSFANSAYASANVKARVWESDTPPTANNYDLWLDSSNGVTYIYTTSNGVSTWVEFGPIGTPLSNLGDFTFNSQTMTGSYANQDVIIYQMGTGNIVLHSANTVAGNLIPNTAFSNIGTVANPWNRLVASNVTSQNVSVTGVVQVNNSTFLATSAAVSITGSSSATIQTPSNDGYMLHITGKDDIPTRTVIDSFGANSYSLITGRHARGTPQAPTAIANNDVLMRLAGNGWGTTGFAPLGVARIDIVASENYSDTARGSRILFYNIPNGSNVVQQIASFNADSVTFTGHVNPQKGFIFSPRTSTANATSIVVDFSTDSSIRATIDADTTVSFTNFTAGKVVDLWITNFANQNKVVTHGVSGLNATNNSATKTIPSTSTMMLKYFCYDGDVANTFVAITQG